MSPDERWATIHAYRREFLAGSVPWIDCPDCEVPLRVVVDGTDEPALRCDACNTLYRPGGDVWNQLRRNLNEVPQL